MTTLTRRCWTTFGLALAACVLPLGSAQAAPETENIATAEIRQDDSRAFDFAWDLSSRRGDDAVLHFNSATARATCQRCGATAIAFQIVTVVGSPTTVAPKNYAEAINVECTACVVAAEARQFVRVVPEPVQFTGTGRSVLADVRDDLAALETQDLAPDQLHLQIETQEARVRQVLQSELVLKSDPSKTTQVLQSVTLQDAELG